MWARNEQASAILQRRNILLHSPSPLPSTLQVACIRFESFTPRIKVEGLLSAQIWGCLESQPYLPRLYVKATLSHSTPTTDISYFTMSSGTEFFQKPLILIRERNPRSRLNGLLFRGKQKQKLSRPQYSALFLQQRNEGPG